MTNTQFNKMLVNKNLEEYLKADKKRKGKLLDNIEKLSGMHRKSIIRAIKRRQQEGKRRRGGSKKKYFPESIELLELVWETGDYICAERLESQVETLLEDCQVLKILNRFLTLLKKDSVKFLGDSYPMLVCNLLSL